MNNKQIVESLKRRMTSGVKYMKMKAKKELNKDKDLFEYLEMAGVSREQYERYVKKDDLENKSMNRKLLKRSIDEQ